MKITGNITKDDLFHLLAHNLKSGKKPKITYMILLIYPLILWGPITRLIQGEYRITDWMLFIPIFILIGLPLILRKNASKVYEMHYETENPVEMELTDDAIRMSTSRHSSTYSWPDIKEVSKKKHMIVFKLSTNPMFSIPRHWFESEIEYENFFTKTEKIANQNMEPMLKTPVE